MRPSWKPGNVTQQPHIPENEPSTTVLCEHKISHTYHKAGNEVVTQVQDSQVQHCQDPVRENSRDGIITGVKFLEIQAGIQHRLDLSYVSLCPS